LYNNWNYQDLCGTELKMVLTFLDNRMENRSPWAQQWWTLDCCKLGDHLSHNYSVAESSQFASCASGSWSSRSS